jgi:hypothetical protein
MRLLLLTSILLLGACAEQAALPTAWVRADGRPINSGLLDIDSLDCKDKMLGADEDGSGKMDNSRYSEAKVQNFVGCMRERGYVQIKS